MAYGLPVVTTSVGIEGFAPAHTETVLVGDTPSEFAEAVVRLYESDSLYQAIRSNAWTYVKENYSEEAAAANVSRLFHRLAHIRVKRLALTEALPRKAALLKQEAGVFMQRYILWRFRRR